MELKDSKTEKLSYNQVLFGAITNLRSSGQIPEDVPMKQAVGLILQEIGEKNVQTVQVGNTIFLGVRNKERDNMYVRIYNMDVGRNIINNMYQYGAFLQKNGVTHVSARIGNERLLPGLRVLKKKFEEKGTKLEVVELENSAEYGMFVKFGDKPLMEAA